MSLTSKIDDIKAQVDQLRRAIQIERMRVNDFEDFPSLEEFSLADKPRVRRNLKGHFGKVYAMHWSGNG